MDYWLYVSKSQPQRKVWFKQYNLERTYMYITTVYMYRIQ